MTVQLKVSRIPSTVTEDSLIFFFENTRRSGGGPVKDIDYDVANSVAFITFEDDGVVESVVNKSKSETFLLENVKIEVESHITDTVSGDSYNTEKQEQEQEERGHAIVVSGIDPKTAEETLRIYFEGKRGANADVIAIRKSDDGDAFILWFETEEDINNILQKSHKLTEKQLIVKKYEPPKPLPKYKNKVFITGANPNTTNDAVRYFLEACSLVATEEIIFGEELGSALVAFKKDIDIDDLREKCNTRTLEDRYLAVQEVTVSDTIMVTGFTDNTTEETLQFYFENKRRSGVEEVKKVKMVKEEGECFISFPDHNDVKTVCERRHTVDGSTLQLKIHHNCLGNPKNKAQSFQFRPPAPYQKEVETQKMPFILKEEHKETLAKKLLENYGRINWTNAPSLEIECTLDESVKDCRKLGTNWPCMIDKALQSYLDGIDIREINTSSEILDEIKAELEQLNDENTHITINTENNTICVVGTAVGTTDAFKQIEEKINKAEKKIDEKKNRVSEKITLKKFETELFSATKFQDQFTQERDLVVVEIDVENNCLVLTGKNTSISNAKVKVMEKKMDIEKKTVEGVHGGMLQFLQINEVKAVVDRALVDNGVIATWSIKDGNEVVMYSFSDEDVAKAVQTLRKSVSSTVITVTKAQSPVLKTEAWKRLVQNVQETGTTEPTRIKVCDENIELYCTQNTNKQAFRELIEDFVHNNEEKQQQINLPMAQKRFFREQYKQELLKIETDLQKQGLHIKTNEDGICLTGPYSVFQDASKTIDRLRKDIVWRTQSIEKAGIVQHLDSQDGKAKISNVEQQWGVVISIGEDKDVEEKEEGVSTHIETALCTTSTGQKITTVLGDITELKADVLVNAANETLDHYGGLAGAIVQKGGKSIQTECSDYLKGIGSQSLSAGEVVCSGPGILPFHLIAHVVSCPYQDGRHNEGTLLSKCITRALEETAAKGFKSVAIPAVGTGVYGFPIEGACLVIVDAIKDFLKSSKNTSLQQIYLCDIQELTVEQFVVALKKTFNKSNVSDLGVKGTTKGHYLNDDKDADIASFDFETSFNQMKIAVIQGQLAKEKVHVIVNSTSTDLQLTNGAVSKSLLTAGGKTLQDECTQKYPNGVNPGEVAVTNGGGLQCRNVYHGALNHWSDINSSKDMETFITNCLKTASKSGFDSIAFPALGTGNLGYPKEEVAKMMFSCVEKFGRMNPQTSLIDVRFVIYDQDLPVLQAFQDEEKQHQLRNQGQSNNQSAVNKRKVSMNFDHATFTLHKEDICKVSVEVIVNCTDVNCTRGIIWPLLLQKGGDHWKQEITIIGSNIKKDKISITSGDKNLGWNYIIHLDVEDTSLDLKDKLGLVISKMEEFGQKSVAFPTDDMGDATTIVSSFVEVLQTYNGNDMEVHGVGQDSKHLAELKDRLNSYFLRKPSTASGYTNWVVPSGGKQRRKPQLHAPKVQSHSKQSITVYGKSDTIVERAISTFEKALERALKTEIVEDMLIKNLPKTDIDELANQLLNYPVEVTVQRQHGIIRLVGFPENILSPVTEIHEHLRHAKDMKHARERARLLSEMVQWVFIEVENDGEKLVEYPPDVNEILENAFRENKTKVDFRDINGAVYIVDLQSYTEYLEDNPTDCARIIRKDKVKAASNYEPPTSWLAMNDRENIKLVTLNSTDSEYVKVSTEFCKTQPDTIKSTFCKAQLDRNAHFHRKCYNDLDLKAGTSSKIQRVQNKSLHQQYMAKKQSMDSLQQVEMTLWHGTKYEALPSINTYGFNRSYCGSNVGAIYGNGVYFAKNASYSAAEHYAPRDHNNQQHMYLCKVLTGEFTKGEEGVLVPPTKPGGGHLLYDSVVDDVDNPEIFVIFNDSQAYPEYIIHFE